jgi:aerotaxis receptor
MKNNQPITQREIPFPPDTYLVSRTDLKGIITYANDAFVAISGFTREELIGSSHNIVRHPDMPEAAFADLWATVKKACPGAAWSRTAARTAISTGSKPLSYRSRAMAGSLATSRYAPPPKATGGQRPRPPTGPPGRPAACRPPAAAACRWPPAVGFDCRHPGADAAGRRDRPAWRQRKQCSLQTLYQDKQMPSNLANKMMFLLSDNRAQIMLALQHDPANPSAKLHDHPLDLHVENTLKNRGEINAALDELKAHAERAGAGAVRQVQRHPRTLLERRHQRCPRPAQGRALPAGQRVAAAQDQSALRRDEARRRGLINELSRSAAEAHQTAEARYATIRNLTIGSLIGALLLGGIGGWLLTRSITPPCTVPSATSSALPKAS